MAVRWMRWALMGVGVVATPLLPGCACGTHECPQSQVGKSWCEDGARLSCVERIDPDGGSNQHLLREECAAMGMMCLPIEEGLIAFCAPEEAACNATLVGTYQCRPTEAGPRLHLCDVRRACEEELYCDEEDPYCGDEGGRCAEWETWRSEGLPCVACDSHCECDVGMACVEGQCQPGAAPQGFEKPCGVCRSSCECESGFRCLHGYCEPGPAPIGQLCCGRERGGGCPAGEACVNADGTEGVCVGGARCDPCEGPGDCASLDCVTPTGAEGPVCLNAAEAQVLAEVCVEPEGAPPEIWSRNACGALVEQVAVCEARAVCDGDVCDRLWPNIEVYPTLLELPEAVVGETVRGTVSIGNLGEAFLEVSAITLTSQTPEQFSASPEDATVQVDEIVEVSVEFTPTTPGDFSARLIISSDDEDEPEVQVLINAASVSQ